MTGDVSSSGSSETRSYSDGAPWMFRGRAFYQLHAVKTSVARRFVPPELKLVEAFGYTLGGLFLANYDGSPAGPFDEAVVIAGIVWNAPTSCAWAGRVLVGSAEARIHGRREVGLPSHLASFSHSATQLSPPAGPSNRPWWDARVWFARVARKKRDPKVQNSVEIVQRDGITSLPLCRIVGIPRLQPIDSSPLSSPGDHSRWRGPAIQLALPNFSGRTSDQPKLLMYSCALKCRVSVVGSARITCLTSPASLPIAEGTGEDDEGMRTRGVLSILEGKPLASIFFDEMVMRVETPQVCEDFSKERRNQPLLKPAAVDADDADLRGASASPA